MAVDVSEAPSETMMRIIKTRVEKKERAIEGDVRFDTDVQKIEIFTHENMWRQIESYLEKENVYKVPCPICGLEPSQDCCYSTYDSWNGEHDCSAPDQDGDLMCEDCSHLSCSLCKMKEAYNFTKEEFCIK